MSIEASARKHFQGASVKSVLAVSVAGALAEMPLMTQTRRRFIGASHFHRNHCHIFRAAENREMLNLSYHDKAFIYSRHGDIGLSSNVYSP